MTKKKRKNADPITEEQLRILRRYFMDGYSVTEARRATNHNIGVIEWWYQKFRLDGVTRCSCVQQQLIQGSGLFGMSIEA